MDILVPFLTPTLKKKKKPSKLLCVNSLNVTAVSEDMYAVMGFPEIPSPVMQNMVDDDFVRNAYE